VVRSVGGDEIFVYRYFYFFCWRWIDQEIDCLSSAIPALMFCSIGGINFSQGASSLSSCKFSLVRMIPFIELTRPLEFCQDSRLSLTTKELS
jgi:hypothetical protein